jgi:4,5-DOPA dioxygenase extradiol
MFIAAMPSLCTALRVQVRLRVAYLMHERMPAIFFGHGNPMNALVKNEYTAAWGSIGSRIPRPRAILSVSAHWFVPVTAVTAMRTPRTIHDFGGFPRELYEVRYPAPGAPDVASRVRQLLAPLHVALDESWGLDHGTWSVLCHVFPSADVPVIQLSIDETQPPGFHYDTGRRLRALRDEGILVMGSGDIVHNLHTYAWGGHPTEPYEWAVRFEARARELMVRSEHAPLVDYASWGRDAALSVPTPEHYLPLLYVLGAGMEGERITFPVEGVDGGSVSMLAVQLG